MLSIVWLIAKNLVICATCLASKKIHLVFIFKKLQFEYMECHLP